MELNIYNLINNNNVICLLNRESNSKHTLLKDNILRKEEIRSSFEGIAFDDIAFISPNIDKRQLFDEHRNNNYDLFDLFTRNEEGKLEPFKYVLAVLGRDTGSHKYLDTVPNEIKEMSQAEILVELDFTPEDILKKVAFL